MLKYIYIILAFLALALGGLGIILPGLPTTPFVLLAAGLFIRSSEKQYKKLVNSRIFGPYITRYMVQKGMTRREKSGAVILMWIMIAFSMIAIDRGVMYIVLPLLACIGTASVVFAVRTVNPKDPGERGSEEVGDES